MKLIGRVQVAVIRRKQPGDRTAPHYLSFVMCVEDNLHMTARKIVVADNYLYHESLQPRRSWHLLKNEN